jgi:hypothetical protein
VLVPNSGSQDRGGGGGREVQTQHALLQQHGDPAHAYTLGLAGMGPLSLGMGVNGVGMPQMPGMPPLHPHHSFPGAGMGHMGGLGMPMHFGGPGGQPPNMSGIAGFPQQQQQQPSQQSGPTASAGGTSDGSSAAAGNPTGEGSSDPVDVKLEGAGGGTGPSGLSSGTPAPLPLPSWLPGQSHQSAQQPSPFTNNVYWQTLAINNMGTSLTGLSHSYFLHQHLQQQQQQQYGLYNQYPGLTQLGAYGAADGCGGAAYDPAAAYSAVYGPYGAANSFNSGPFGVMSQLARNFYPLPSSRLKAPRSYKRNKRAAGEAEGGDADGAGSGHKRAKLSARDRKMQDMLQSAGGGINAEQFLAGTMHTDRYRLGQGGSSLLAPTRPYRRKKQGDEDDAEGADRKGRGRPRGRRGPDEGSYQDGEGYEEGGGRGTGRGAGGGGSKRAKGRRRGDDEDSDDSSASQGQAAGRSGGSSRRLVRGGGSSRNLTSASPDPFLRSGLSQHSSLQHLTEGAEDDLIDLRNPRSRRVHIDFTLPALEALAAMKGEPVADSAKDGAATSTAANEGPDYVCGFYRGELHLGRKDHALHYKLHGSRALPESLLKLNSDLTTAAGAASNPVRAQATMIAVQNQDNAPRSTRVGEAYQCEVPALQPVPGSAGGAAGAGVTRRSVSSVTEGLVWRPGQLSEARVDAFLELLRARKALVPLAVGSVLVVHLVSEGAFRLCCVLDVHLADPAAVAAGLAEETAVRVFDGYEVSPCAVTFVYYRMCDACSFSVAAGLRGGGGGLHELRGGRDGGGTTHPNQPQRGADPCTSRCVSLPSYPAPDLFACVRLSQALVQEVDWLLRSERANSHGPTSWSSEDVHDFCSAVHRYVLRVGERVCAVGHL